MTEKSNDFNRLEKTIANLKIHLSQDEDGHFTVFSLSEPLFCFCRDTENECIDLVASTLRSYLENFYQVEGVQVKTVTEPVAAPPIRQRRLRPLSNLRPILSDRGRQPEFA
jgi:hypothetical protein